MNAARSARIRSAIELVWPRRIASPRLVQACRNRAFRASKLSATGRGVMRLRRTADQALHLAFVVALAGTPEPVIEKVMALQFGEHRRTQALATLHHPGHREAGVVIQVR